MRTPAQLQSTFSPLLTSISPPWDGISATVSHAPNNRCLASRCCGALCRMQIKASMLATDGQTDTGRRRTTLTLLKAPPPVCRAGLITTLSPGHHKYSKAIHKTNSADESSLCSPHRRTCKALHSVRPSVRLSVCLRFTTDQKAVQSSNFDEDVILDTSRPNWGSKFAVKRSKTSSLRKKM